jgi:hypothetical protein
MSLLKPSPDQNIGWGRHNNRRRYRQADQMSHMDEAGLIEQQAVHHGGETLRPKPTGKQRFLACNSGAQQRNPNGRGTRGKHGKNDEPVLQPGQDGKESGSDHSAENQQCTKLEQFCDQFAEFAEWFSKGRTKSRDADSGTECRQEKVRYGAESPPLLFLHRAPAEAVVTCATLAVANGAECVVCTFSNARTQFWKARQTSFGEIGHCHAS